MTADNKKLHIQAELAKAAHRLEATEHLAALERHGPCPEHRRSFAPVSQMRMCKNTQRLNA